MSSKKNERSHFFHQSLESRRIKYTMTTGWNPGKNNEVANPKRNASKERVGFAPGPGIHGQNKNLQKNPDITVL
ncbi:MAG: hypothetical protein B1H12_06325 [Desulfobacteraceae bacterium 4484_190.2]|nr:MAG: hypothetical protein B1H12_06325 [Desulfobacteraceae bacterium 4484_190.2]